MTKALEGKRVVLLGGTAGSGLATAHAAAQEGASIVLVSSQQSRVDQALHELPPGTAGHAVDLTNESPPAQCSWSMAAACWSRA
jgi:NAD(P)-dependent dehydrogenase (short-subunit alcohol dehydrogenase family)